MEALKIIGAIFGVLAVAGGISYVLHYYKDDDPPFNDKTIGISLVCNLLFAVGVYLWLGAGFTDNTLVVLGCGILAYVGLLVYVAWWRSNILTAIWTVTSLAVLSTVVVMVVLGVKVLRRRDRRRDRHRSRWDRIIEQRERRQEIGYEQDSC